MIKVGSGLVIGRSEIIPIPLQEGDKFIVVAASEVTGFKVEDDIIRSKIDRQVRMLIEKTDDMVFDQ